MKSKNTAKISRSKSPTESVLMNIYYADLMNLNVLVFIIPSPWWINIETDHLKNWDVKIIIYLRNTNNLIFNITA